ncbi:MAG TPA: adenine phosphoribosyltransferase [Mycobacteriales bacterium]|nr:adenine phosphoribosyltransferase [Mycobacteriales bacterium]
MSDLAERVAGLVRDVPDFPTPGILFRDIAPLLRDPQTFGDVVGWFAERAAQHGATVVVGIESRGFLLGAPAALRANVPFVPVRKAGKLPGPVHGEACTLEYGETELQVQVGALHEGDRVLVVDDVLATGGTAGAAAALVRADGAEPVELAVLLELEALSGRGQLAPWPVSALLAV